MIEFWDPMKVEDVAQARMDKRYVTIVGHYSSEVHLELWWDSVGMRYLLVQNREVVGDTLHIIEATDAYNALLEKARRAAR